MNTIAAAELKRRGMSAVQCLLSQPSLGTKDKALLDEELRLARRLGCCVIAFFDPAIHAA